MSFTSTRAVAGSVALLLGTTMLWGTALADPTPKAPDTDALRAGFADPPMSARPRVWWHWLAGNVTKDGIAKDLDWMKRSGLGGVQTFDAALSTPQIVDRPLAYMTPEWQDAFRYAANLAEQKGLELGIAASPGWSETGGPWVKPEDGMKKLVWSETPIQGGRRFKGMLAAPPSTTGPFADLVLHDTVLAALGGGKSAPDPVLYGDVAVMAYRVSASEPTHRPVAMRDANGAALDIQALSDGGLATGVLVQRQVDGQPGAILIDYEQPQTVRSVSFFSPNAATMFATAPIRPRLEASDDGKTWRKIADIDLTIAPTTVAVETVTARHFRVVLAANPDATNLGLSTPAPGVDLSGMAAIFAPKPTIEVVDLRLSPQARINQFEAKAGFSTVSDYYALDASGPPDEPGVAVGDVIDLTGKMKPDGSLDWTPPAGQWSVLRLGYSLTGRTNHPANPEATGLEVDKYDAEAVRRYLTTYLDLYKAAAGPDLIGARGVRAIVTDSTEVGTANWTPRMVEQFKALRGYDPSPWLPALAGVIVGSRARSDAFLYDFRRTIADLHAREHYGTVAEVAHENGLIVYGEALEGGRPTLGDDIEMRRYADVPMSALWSYRREDGPKQAYLADMRGAASTAHLYGKPYVAAESMTSAMWPWAQAPADLKKVVDLEFASGVNRPVIHTSVHQPVDDKVPGISLSIFGQYFNRHETWAEMARPWVDYIARSSYLLQQGRFVADVAYFYGEEAPTVPMSEKVFITDVPKTYGYDFVNVDGLLNQLSVVDGDLTAKSGARYRVLYLGGSSQRMTLPVLRRVASLAEAGATVIGLPPQGGAGLQPTTAEYQALVSRLWSGQPVTRVGRGRVIAGRDVEAGMREAAIASDFSYLKSQPDSELMFVHRQLADGELYFVANRRNGPERTEVRFRVSGKAPQLWRADTGQVVPAAYRIEGGETVVPLDLATDDAVFVVFRDPAAASSRTIPAPKFASLGRFEKPWRVQFQAGRGAPAETTLPTLASLSAQSEPGVRYFSGVATYSSSFTLPTTAPDQPLVLDLGAVGDLAEVRVNGQAVGSAWRAPYRLDITKAARPGENIIEVKVANLWANRLIGDAQPGAAKITFATGPGYSASAPLRPSGLIGPVQILGRGQ